MNDHRCDSHVPESDLYAHLRDELDERESTAVATHVAACETCARELLELRRADGVLAEVREGESAFPELRLAAVRTRVMEAIRQNPRRVHRFALPRLAWAAAAGIAMVAVMVGLRPQVATEQARNPSASSYHLDAAVALVTTSTTDGIALKWEGDEPTYLVLKTHRPGDFRDAEVEVVCGNTWTDTSRASGLTYYQVVPAQEPCRS